MPSSSPSARSSDARHCSVTGRLPQATITIDATMAEGAGMGRIGGRRRLSPTSPAGSGGFWPARGGSCGGSARHPVDADLLHVHEARARLIGAFAVAVLVSDEEDRPWLNAVALRKLQHPLRIGLDPLDVVARDDVRHAPVEAVERQRALDGRLAV